MWARRIQERSPKPQVDEKRVSILSPLSPKGRHDLMAPTRSATSVNAGSYLSMAINAHGQLVWWGGDSVGATQLAAKARTAIVEVSDDHTQTKLAEQSAARGLDYEPALLKLWIPRAGAVVQVSAGGRHGVLLLESGDVFTFGENTYGQLGTGDFIPVTTPRAVDFFRVSRTRCAEVAAGRMHSLAIDTQGVVYSWGQGQNGALGLRSLDDCLTPTPVELLGQTESLKKLGHVISISASDHSIAITSRGTVYAWGLGSSGQLGLGDTRSHRKPRLIGGMHDAHVIGASCGHEHTLLLTRDGTAFSFGQGSSGQLGHGVREAELQPRAIAALEAKGRVAQVAAGGSHSLFLLENGTVQSCGASAFGALGQGGFVKEALVPREITGGYGIEKVMAVAAGFLHSIVVTIVGQTFAFGANSSLQLGETRHAYSSVPRLVYGLHAQTARDVSRFA